MALEKKWMEMRKSTPEVFKRIYRLAQLVLEPYPASAPTIPQELLNDCKFLNHRNEMLKHLPSGKILEIGTLAGGYANCILEACNPEELHLVDLTFDTLMDIVRENPVVKMHEGKSGQILSQFEDEYFDWIYVDADHSYEGVQADIKLAMNKVKPGGYLVFNDFARIVRKGFGVFGVHQAVCEFIVEYEWPMAYFCFNGEALYDVALKKPQ